MNPRGSARVALPLAFGLLAALMFLSLAQAVPHAAILGFFSPLPLMAAALGLGLVSTLIAGAVGAVATGVVAGLPFGITFAGLAILPGLVVAGLALRTEPGPDGRKVPYPPGKLLAWLTVAAVVLTLAWVAALPPHADGLRAWLQEFLSKALEMLGDRVTEQDRDDIAKALSTSVLALIAGVWLTMSVINAMAAQAILGWAGQALRPAPRYTAMELPLWLVGIPVVAGVVWAVGNETASFVAANIVAVGLLPFAALGTAQVHRRLAAGQWPVLGLVALYAMLMVFSVWALGPLAIVGLVRFVRTEIDRRNAGTTEVEDGSDPVGED